MSTHTPGPWIIEENDSQPFVCNAMNADAPYGTVFASRVMLADGGIIALVQFTDPDNEVEDRANARVISAAPDLLAACKVALRMMREHGHTHDAPKQHPDYDILDQFDTGLSSPLSAVLEAAIAKAEGT